MNQRFSGKVVLVVGAGSSGPGWGNGKAAAVSYARNGGTVIAADVRDKAAEETVAIIRGEGGAGQSVAVDASDPVSVESMVSRVLDDHGRIDVLHNNVGVVGIGEILDLEPADWNLALQVNLSSVFLTMRAVLPGMVGRGRGAIVNISSVAGLRYTGYSYPAYATAKAAINHLTAVTAVRYARDGVRVNAVAPGLIDTPLIYQEMSSEYSSVEEMVAARDAMSPTGRMGTPWDVANAALFLASDDAAYINGVTLPVDGGLTVRCV
jgi:NAD(P)-dependent dehydrogenase (short-subunit alcohol dehydrogenase family)